MESANAEDKKRILDAYHFRHACKEFDAARKIPDDDFSFILEAGRLSPSSFGFEPWTFVIVQNSALREKIGAMSWGAKKQAPTASHFMVLLARTAQETKYGAPYLTHIMKDIQNISGDAIAAREQRLRSFQENEFKLLDEDGRRLFDWACKQTYIALGNMLTAAALIGIDSCPIEGFDREKLESLLTEEGELDRSRFGVACMAAFGYRKQPPQ